MGARTHGLPSRVDGQVSPSLPTILRERYRGAAGLAAFPIEGRFDSRDPEAFDAVLTRVQLGALELRRLELSPHRAVLDGATDPAAPQILRLLTVREGTMLVAPPGGRPSRIGPGDAMFTCQDRSYAYQADSPVVMVNAVMPVTVLPPDLRALDRLPVGRLPHRPLVDAVVELMARLADRFEEPWEFDADYAARGMIDLETAILTEVLGPGDPAVGPDRVYLAAVAYIERHLGDPELRPPQIAEAIGVSLRYLHRAFDDKEATVARHLRERRLDLVADALRGVGHHPTTAALAERYGFGSQDRLARAFRRRYGMSIAEFRATASR